jgi:hypothetical protein
MSIEAMKMALDVLIEINKLSIGENAIALPGEIDAAMDNLRAAIEQSEKQDYIKLEAAYFSGLADGKEVVEQYDQNSLELCKECGWKAIIPGDGCLVCARQKAKPVAYVDERIHGWPDCFVMEPDPPHTVPLYTAPRQWVELTDDEARALVNRATFGDKTNWQALVYMVDAKLKEKNHG